MRVINLVTVPVHAQIGLTCPSCSRERGRAMGVCGVGCGGDAAAAVAAAAGTCSSGDPWRHPSYAPCQLCGGWSGPPGSGRRWLCGDALMCAPSQHLRSADRCSPASGTPVDTPGHLWILSDRRHAQDLKMRTEKEKGWVGRGGQRRKGRESVQDESSHKNAQRFQAYTHAKQTRTSESKWSRNKDVEKSQKENKRERERDGGMLDYLPSGQNDSPKDSSFFLSCEWKKKKKLNSCAIIFIWFCFAILYFEKIPKSRCPKVRYQFVLLKLSSPCVHPSVTFSAYSQSLSGGFLFGRLF